MKVMVITITIKSISSKDVEKERVMYSECNNVRVTSYNEANEVVDKLFELLCSRYQGNLEK